MWKQLDLVERRPVRLASDDVCFYARDYASGKSYSYSEANRLITNLKKPRSTENTFQWKHKLKAIQQFARELAGWMNNSTEEFYVAAIPSSKRSDHPDYDPRLEMVLQSLKPLCANANICKPIIRSVNKIPAHHSGTKRPRPTIRECYESLSWTGLNVPPRHLILIDDVVTTGTTFRACKTLAQQNCSNLEVYGVFWCQTVWPEEDFSDVDFDDF